jgi:hypothetical protein
MIRRSAGRFKIRPGRRNIRARAVRQNQHQIELALSFELTKYCEDLACQCVLRTCNPNVCGKLSEGGSVSWVSLTG